MTVTKTEKVYPPNTLLKNCPKPILIGNQNRDLVNYAIELIEAIELCNADKAALRDWRNSEHQGNNE